MMHGIAEEAGLLPFGGDPDHVVARGVAGRVVGGDARCDADDRRIDRP
jgi:hypothetical protein